MPITHFIYVLRDDHANPSLKQTKIIKRCSLKEAEEFLSSKFDSFIGTAASQHNLGYALTVACGTRVEKYVVEPIEKEGQIVETP